MNTDAAHNGILIFVAVFGWVAIWAAWTIWVSWWGERNQEFYLSNFNVSSGITALPGAFGACLFAVVVLSFWR